jgi:hypothetical protein
MARKYEKTGKLGPGEPLPFMPESWIKLSNDFRNRREGIENSMRIRWYCPFSHVKGSEVTRNELKTGREKEGFTVPICNLLVTDPSVFTPLAGVECLTLEMDKKRSKKLEKIVEDS